MSPYDAIDMACRSVQPHHCRAYIAAACSMAGGFYLHH